MGNYATYSALAISMRGVSFDTATSALATQLIGQAESEINSSLSKRFDLSSNTFQTYTSIPPQVRTWAERLAEGFMWHSLSRGGASKEGQARGDGMVKAVRLELKGLVDHNVNLLDTTGSVIPDKANSSYRVLCNTSDYTPTFNEDDELSWRQDCDKLTDIASERD